MVLAKYNHFFDFLTFDKGLKTHSNPIRTGQRVVIVGNFFRKLGTFAELHLPCLVNQNLYLFAFLGVNSFAYAFLGRHIGLPLRL